MRRRVVLASLAGGVAGLSGCSFGTDETDTSTTPGAQTDARTDQPDGTADRSPTPEDTDTPDEPDPPAEWTRVIDLETGARTVVLDPTRVVTDDGAAIALWFDRTATPDHPARITGWLENTNDFENTFRIDEIPVVGGTTARRREPGDGEPLTVVPTERNEIATGVPNVSRGEKGYWHVADRDSWMPETHRLEPAEFVALEYVLVGKPGSPSWETGIYEFPDHGTSVELRVWNTDAPGPNGTSRFAGRSLPPLDDEAGSTWYHEADRPTPVYVEPARERVELDGRIDVAVVNHSREGVGCGHWNLYKLVEGEWFHVGPQTHQADCRTLAPGDRKPWTLRAFNGEAVPCDGEASCADGLTRGYLGGGEYAIVAGYGEPGGPERESAALLTLVGDRAPVVVTDDARTERAGDRVIVVTDRYDDGEPPTDSTLTLTRAETATDRLLAEQVMATETLLDRPNALRNALAAMTADVDRVVVRTGKLAIDQALGVQVEQDSTRRFRFRGQAYEARRGNPDD